MANLNISLSYPDEKQDELIEALKHKYGDLTNQELLANYRQDARQLLKDIYKEHQYFLLTQARKRLLATDDLDVVEN